jgi:hypothetical protein
VATPIEVASTVLLADPEFSIDLSTTTFPFTIPPGENRRVPILYAPASLAQHSGTLTVTHNVGDPLVATLRGEGMVGELIYSEFDVFYPLGPSGFSGLISFDLPSEAISIAFYALDFNAANIDITYLEGPDGKVYTDFFAGPWQWWRALPNGLDNGWQAAGSALSAMLPNSNETDAQLVKGGGTYMVEFQGDPFSDLLLRIVVEQRQNGATADGRLPLNIFLAPSLPVDATTAPTDGKIISVLDRVQEILLGAGITVGPVFFYKMNPGPYDDLPSEADVDFMLLWGPFDSVPFPFTPTDFPEERLSLFFVRSIGGGDIPPGVLGLSNGIPCPKPGPFPLTSNHTGVVVGYATPPPDEVGKTTARQICQALGLLATVSSDGLTFDLISDTPECPVTGTTEDCPIEGADNLLHPFDLGPQAIKLSGGQRFVCVRHPFCTPGR